MSQMTRSPFSSAAFAQLVRRLRHTNVRYNQIALQFHRSLRRTNHAKRRAYRAGLRINITKARACPDKCISTHPPPVLDPSEENLSWLNAPAIAYATTETSLSGGQDVHSNQRNAYMRPAPVRRPEVIVRKRRRDRCPRVVLRVPPLKLPFNPDFPYSTPFDGPAPGAPKLSPRQLPEDDCGAYDVMHELADLTFTDCPGSDPAYSGLCITVPPRTLKRKLQDIEPDETAASLRQYKRFLEAH